MTTIEEQIWDYIDGIGSAEYRSEIESKIATDEAYKAIYQDLSALHQQIGDIGLDEPSMSFSRNVMEMVSLEIAPVSMKTKVDKRIIYGVSAFFIIAIAAIFIYALSQLNFTASKVTLTFNLTNYMTPALFKGFLFADVIIGLLYLDRLLRKKLV